MRPGPTSRRASPSRLQSRRSLAALAVFTLLIASCGGGATPAPTIPPGAVVVHARNLAFDTKELQIPAATEFTLAFVNEDGDTHNIAIRTQSGGGGDLLFRFDPVSAKTVILTAGPIPKGNYFFLCEVHPQMTGTVFAY